MIQITDKIYNREQNQAGCYYQGNLDERCENMVFGSISFLLYFFPLFFIIFAVTPIKYRKYVLTLGSVVFYTEGLREIRGALLFLIMILVNFGLGCRIYRAMQPRQSKRKRERSRKKVRIWLIAGIVINAGVLMLYKFGVLKRGMPLGISFFTFQNIAYLVDVYRGETVGEKSFVNYLNYMFFFPKAGSGPITRYQKVRYELEKPKISAEKIQSGLGVFTAGLAYKVLLADRIGTLWYSAQSIGYESLSVAYAWLAAIAYSMRLYFDFYGYSLMAVGLGRILGVTLPENFRDPYMARGVRGFYRRWHITLGTWFRDYVYIPLGGSKKGKIRTILHLLCVWLLTGLWHGVSLNFVLWGVLLCLLIIMERAANKKKLFARFKILPHLYLWAVIPVTWVCFAITDTGDLLVYLGRMSGLLKGINVRSRDWLYALEELKYYLAAGAVACTPLLQKIYRRYEGKWWSQLALAVLFWICVWRIHVDGNNPFMYFNF